MFWFVVSVGVLSGLAFLFLLLGNSWKPSSDGKSRRIFRKKGPAQKTHKAKAGPVPAQWDYESCVNLLTKTEQLFFLALQEAVEGRYSICCKVRMEDLIKVKKGAENAYGLRARIRPRHVDFVLWSPDTAKINLAIELDDPSHNSAKAREADKFKNEAFESAGVPLLRVKTEARYHISDLTEAIKKRAI